MVDAPPNAKVNTVKPGDMVVDIKMKDQKAGENPAANGKLVFRNSRDDLLKIADRPEFVEELQEFLDEVRDFAENIGNRHGVKLNMEVVFDVKKVKFRRKQLKSE